MENIKTNRLPLADFIDRVLIFDDEKEDADDLTNVLSKREIVCEWFTPEKLKNQQFHKNRQLIFCDLHMFENLNSSVEIAGAIRKLLQSCLTKSFGAYGLIVWTAHKDEVDDLTTRLSKDRKESKYNTPVFVLSMNKLLYKENKYESLWEDLLSNLQESISSCFYVSWGNIVKKGFNNAVTSLYSKTEDYNLQDKTMQSVLSSMALNNTGIPEEDVEEYPNFSEDTYKSMNDMLSADINGNGASSYDLYNGKFIKPSFKDLQEELHLDSFLNANLFLTPGQPDQNQIVPGNVYEVKTGEHSFVIKDQKPKNSVPILIELTPPCDYSHKKITSRLVAGFIIECPGDNDKLYDMVNKTCSGLYRYTVWPIEVNSIMSLVCFDFRHLYSIEDDLLKDTSKYELMFRFSHRLFADILQKFSSHAARLGENMLKPKLAEPKIVGETCLKEERVLIDKLKGKLEKDSHIIPIKEYRKMAKARNFDIDKDKNYLSMIFMRNGIEITGEGVRLKVENGK